MKDFHVFPEDFLSMEALLERFLEVPEKVSPISLSLTRCYFCGGIFFRKPSRIAKMKILGMKFPLRKTPKRFYFYRRRLEWSFSIS